MIVLQSAPFVDHVTDDGTELTKMPYPLVCDDHGCIKHDPEMASRLPELPVAVLGFANDLNHPGQIDLEWNTFVAELPVDAAVGKHLIVKQANDRISAMSTPVESAQTL